MGREALLDTVVTTLVHQLATDEFEFNAGIGAVPAAVGLVGLPGVGKTALARALAADRRLRRAYPDGVLWAALGPAPTVEGLLRAWGVALGLGAADLDRMGHIGALSCTLRACLGSKRHLLVVDDAWSAEAALAFRLGGLECAHIVTTRLPAIAYHFAPDMVVHVPELAPADALALLTRLAPEAVAAEPLSAQAVAQATGGLPLALTLVGHHLHATSRTGQTARTRETLVSLRREETWLTLAAPVAPVDVPSATISAETNKMHYSLDAAIALSVATLDPASRRLLGALAYVPPKPQSFPEEVAYAVGGAKTGEALDTLLDTGLLETTSPGRYTLHQAVARHACLHSLLDEPPTRFLKGLLSWAVSRTRKAEPIDDTSELVDDWPVILDILDKASDGTAQEDRRRYVRAVLAIAPAMLTHRWYEAAGRHLDRAESLTANVEDVLTRREHVWLHLRRARCYLLRGDLTGAWVAYERAANYLEDAPNAGNAGNVRKLACAVELYSGRGEVAMHMGRVATARNDLERALALGKRTREPQRLPQLLRLLGEVAVCENQPTIAEARWSEGLVLARRTGEREAEATLLQDLGSMAAKSGRNAAALSFLRDGLRVARESSYRHRECALLNTLGVTLHWAGCHGEAEQCLEESLAMAGALGNPMRQAMALFNLGDLALTRRAPTRAAKLIDDGLTLARELGAPTLLCEGLLAHGEVLLTLGDPAAAHTFDEVLLMAGALADDELSGLASFGAARVMVSLGRDAEANQYAHASLATLTQLGHRAVEEVAQWLAGH